MHNGHFGCIRRCRMRGCASVFAVTGHIEMVKRRVCWTQSGYPCSISMIWESLIRYVSCALRSCADHSLLGCWQTFGEIFHLGESFAKCINLSPNDLSGSSNVNLCLGSSSISRVGPSLREDMAWPFGPFALPNVLALRIGTCPVR